MATAPVFQLSGIDAICNPAIQLGIAGILQAMPFVGRVRIERAFDTIGYGSINAVVCIPARMEADYVASAIAAVDEAANNTRADCGLVLIVNNSDDATFEIACKELVRTRLLPALVLDCRFDPDVANIGHARRLAMDIASEIFGAEYLLSTDADGRVAADWIARAIGALDNADMVCGTVVADESDIAALPDAVAICGQIESELRDALDELWFAINGPAPRGHTNRGSGANMAVSTYAYRASGGLPPLACEEDRALHDVFEVQGRVIWHVDAMRVTASGRLDSRAGGGMADCLRARSTDPDPFVDSQLRTADELMATAVRHHRGVEGPLTSVHSQLRVSQARREIARARRLVHAFRGNTQ